nr:uncharacterized protein LOC112278078 isoform X3 [Physcomitrium patens]|eukprot:XP_024366895.1 uncharacterized protein LOC112278078 isoform X3 [Physcomitrella patens]
MLKIHFIIQNIFIRLYSRFRISAMQLSKCCNATEVASQDTLHYRYLDNIRMDATLNISRLYDLGLLMSKNSTAKPSTLTVLSLMDNNISTVVYDANCIIDIATVIRLQGTPFCKDPYSDDGRRCFCAQSCFNSVPMQETKRKVTIIAVVVSVTSSLILMISLAILFHRNKKLKQYQLLVQQRSKSTPTSPHAHGHMPTWLSPSWPCPRERRAGSVVARASQAQQRKFVGLRVGSFVWLWPCLAKERGRGTLTVLLFLLRHLAFPFISPSFSTSIPPSLSLYPVSLISLDPSRSLSLSITYWSLCPSVCVCVDSMLILALPTIALP